MSGANGPKPGEPERAFERSAPSTPSAPPLRIAHVSDLHFGRIAHSGIVEALVDEINRGDVTLVAVSGDLTQRARPREFRQAADMLSRLNPPVIVVPGNHDVYAWWHPLHRILHPLGRYRRFLTDELAPYYESRGLAVLGINSAYGRTVKGGRIDAAARASVSTFFSAKPLTDFKVLVVHHHLTRVQALGSHDVARKAHLVLSAASAAGVDLVLCGHLHISHIEPVAVTPENHRVIIASAGTATSSRGRGSNVSTNFYNVISIRALVFEIEERRFDTQKVRFNTFRISQFHRVRPADPVLPG